MTTQTYYEILGVEKTATSEEIKIAYFKLSKKLHPDVGGDPEDFMEIHEAYENLSNPELRERYDKTGSVLDFGKIGFALILQVLDVYLDKGVEDNLILVLVHHFQSKKAEINQDRARLAQDVKRFEKMLRRYKSPQDFIGNAFRKKIKKAKRDLNQTENDFATLRACLEVLETCEDLGDLQESTVGRLRDLGMFFLTST